MLLPWTDETPPDERSEDQYAAYTHAEDHRRIARMLADAKSHLAAGETNWAGLVPASGVPGVGMWKPTENYSAGTENNTLATPVGTTFVPMLVPVSMDIDRLAILSSDSGSGTTKFRLGIYAANGPGLRPYSLIVDGGTVSITSNVARWAVTVSTHLDPGLYWVATRYDNTNRKLRCVRVATPYISISDLDTTQAMYAGWSATYLTGVDTAFPDIVEPDGLGTGGTLYGVTISNAMPLSYVRRSA